MTETTDREVLAGLTEIALAFIEGEVGDSLPGMRDQAERFAAILMPTVARLLDEARAEGRDLAAVYGYELGFAEGAAEVRAQMEALADEWERDFMAYRREDPDHIAIRAALAPEPAKPARYATQERRNGSGAGEEPSETTNGPESEER